MAVAGLLPSDADQDELFGLVIPGFTLQLLDPATEAVPHSGGWRAGCRRTVRPIACLVQTRLPTPHPRSLAPRHVFRAVRSIAQAGGASSRSSIVLQVCSQCLLNRLLGWHTAAAAATVPAPIGQRRSLPLLRHQRANAALPSSCSSGASALTWSSTAHEWATWWSSSSLVSC